MNSCSKDLYDYDLVNKCSNCKNLSLKINFFEDRTKKVGYRPECKICCKNYYFIKQNRILNNRKNYNKKNRSEMNAYERQKKKTDFNFKKKL